MHLKTRLKDALHALGLDIHRYVPPQDPFGWLRAYDIKTVIDVGANVGQFAMEARKRLPDATIYSFEPVKECFDTLNERMHGDPRFFSFNIALGDKSGTKELYVHTDTQNSSFLKMAPLLTEMTADTLGGTKRSVAIRTLDDVFSELDCPRNILVKLDVQGTEHLVIAGASRALREATAVLTEASFRPIYEGGVLFDGLHAILKSIGFSYRGNVGGKRLPTGELLFEDSLFIRES